MKWTSTDGLSQRRLFFHWKFTSTEVNIIQLKNIIRLDSLKGVYCSCEKNHYNSLAKRCVNINDLNFGRGV